MESVDIGRSERPHWVEEIKAVGWDLDGTLYPPDSVPVKMIIRKQIKEICNVQHWDMTRAKVEYQRMYAKLHSNTSTLRAFGINGEEFFVKLWDELGLEKYIKRDEKVIQIINYLNKKGLRQFVLSNSNRVDQIEKKLGLVGVESDSFEFLLSTVGLGAVKPESKPFFEAMRRLNMKPGGLRRMLMGKIKSLSPKQVLYVGDREKTDVWGAKQLGMRTALVWGKSELADASCATVYEIKELFE